MSEGYGTSVHINLLRVKVQLAHTVHAHRSEGFIDLQPSSHGSHAFFGHAYLE